MLLENENKIEEQTNEKVLGANEPELVDDKQVKFFGNELGFSTNSVPAFIVEGMLGEAITQVFQQVNYFNELYSDKNHPKHFEWVLQMKSLSVIAYKEAEQVVECLKDMKDATLSPKHRAIRSITKTLLSRMEEREQEMLIATEENHDPVFTDVMKLILEWLKSSTIILSSYTKNKDIAKYTRKWK